MSLPQAETLGVLNCRRRALLILGSAVASAFALGLLINAMAPNVTAQPSAKTAAAAVRGFHQVSSAPIPPPEGFPKLALSMKSVTPKLAPSGGVTLTYAIEIRNTGATTATNTALTDELPESVVYNGDGWASHGSAPVVVDGTLFWSGEVGFDTTVVVTYSVRVAASFSGTLRNTAVISDPHIAVPVTITAEAIVTDVPILVVEKSSLTPKPGPNKPLMYELVVTNWGQPATSLPITLIDTVPEHTTVRETGPDAVSDTVAGLITWTRVVDLDLGQSAFFTFSVDVADVTSGTVLVNETYAVSSPYGISAGQPHTITVVDPILHLGKHVWPDPPGSNREMTFTITVFNSGSLATGLLVTDLVPNAVSYVRGGVESDGVVSWTQSALSTGESAEFTFTVAITDVMNVPVVNREYGVCSFEGSCAAGEVLTSVVQGPIFEAFAEVNPIAHKPGGGTGTEVTPTLRVRNVGAGAAIDALAILYFDRFSVGENDLRVVPDIGSGFPTGPDCGDKCKSYLWVGSLDHGDTVTFTTYEGQSTIGGDEGLHYTATIVITDAMANMTTSPVTGTTYGTITHMANVQPIKTAPAVIGPGQLLTYSILAINRGMTTDLPPVLTDVVPVSTTFVRASDGGAVVPVSDAIYVSWTLPLLSPGDSAIRRFAVLVNDNVLSGTEIVNGDYAVFGYGNVLTGTVTAGAPVTTTVREVGLVDSFKRVTPSLALPGPGNVLTFSVYLVNSSPVPLQDVAAHDILPWAASTYRRDAVASGGAIVSDIISFDWHGDILANSLEVITASVLVDSDYSGALTNTVVISHPSLLSPVVRRAVAYVTDKPVLFIYKSASPDPVRLGRRLRYVIRVVNKGQPANTLVISDIAPNNVTYVPDSATRGGVWQDGTVQWQIPFLDSGSDIEATFQVTVVQGRRVINEHYGVWSAGGQFDLGAPVVTRIQGGILFLPLLVKQN